MTNKTRTRAASSLERKLHDLVEQHRDEILRVLRAGVDAGDGRYQPLLADFIEHYRMDPRLARSRGDERV